MNSATNPSATSLHAAGAIDAAEARFARGFAAHLTLRAASVDPDIGARLRFARERALEAARRSRQTSAAGQMVVSSQGSGLLGFSRSPLWTPIASAVPVLALVAGLFFIQTMQARSQIDTAAEVDTALLGDDLPISAYRDAGFVEFLKSPPPLSR